MTKLIRHAESGLKFRSAVGHERADGRYTLPTTRQFSALKGALGPSGCAFRPSQA